MIDYRGKRLFDFMISVLSLFFLWPIFLLVILAIFLFDNGPIFFTLFIENRVYTNEVFWINQSALSRRGVIRREYGANKKDYGHSTLAAVAKTIHIPPPITIPRHRHVKP